MIDDARSAYEALCDGGVVLLPTDVGFGLVATTDDAVARIYELKGRPQSKACVTVGTAEILDDVALLTSRDRAWILDVASRSPLAVVNPTRRDSRLLRRVSPFMRGQATTNGTIATFMNAGRLVTAIAELAFADGRLLVGSSANVAFTGNNYALEDVPASIRDRVELVIPGARARYHNDARLATTILDVSSGEFVRVGIDHATIATAWAEHCAAAA